MNLIELFKHLSVGRLGVFAALLASAAMYFGPRVAPSYLDPLPKEWPTVVFGVFVFSSFLCVFWTAAYGWALFKVFCIAVWTNHSASKLNSLEQSLLIAMAENPAGTFNLEMCNYKAGSGPTRLELFQVARQLGQKGLVETHMLSQDRVYLSDRGRERALEIQKMLSRETKER